MKRTFLLALAVTSASLVFSIGAVAQIQGALPAVVKLQGVTPGIPDPGHANIDGTMRAGAFIGNGAGLAALNADAVTTGTLADARLSSNIPKLNVPNVFVGPTNQFNGFLGVGRSNPVGSAELFGLGNNSVSGFGGMYAMTNAAGKPFYGYSLNGSSSAYHYLDGPSGSWRLVMNGTNRLNVSSNGNVGIGTVSPQARLDVRGDLEVTNAQGNSIVGASNVSDGGYLYVANHAGDTAFLANVFSGRRGWAGVFDEAGMSGAFMFVDNDNKGYVVADTKNFRVPNPRNAEQDIYYACVEGPEAAAYMRGTGRLVNGQAHITLPTHFTDVTVAQGMTVQTTPGSELSEGLAVKNKANSGFDVIELRRGKGDYVFDWEVKCVRRGHENYEVVRPWTKAVPKSADLSAAWKSRMQSIAIRNAEEARSVSRP